MNASRGGDDWLVCNRTRAMLAQLDRVLRSTITAEDALVRMIALHLIQRGGKRIRPALVFLAAGPPLDATVPLLQTAAAMELIHVASLYHDDVVDRAPMRRSAASANASWGNGLAVVVGTYLFARASAILSALSGEVNRTASAAIAELCTGQLQEVENAYNAALSEAEHLAIVERKTATLFELPCRLGALLTGVSPAAARALSTYGRTLGLAFQLADDALDLRGQASHLGKATGVDLREGVYSLAVLRALQGEPSRVTELRALLRETRPAPAAMQRVVTLVEEAGAVDAALETARAYAAEARAALTGLPEGPAVRSLTRLADYAVARST